MSVKKGINGTFISKHVKCFAHVLSSHTQRNEMHQASDEQVLVVKGRCACACLTCTARCKLLANTWLNVMSLRYWPTASPCCMPVSDRGVSTPWPETQHTVTSASAVKIQYLHIVGEVFKHGDRPFILVQHVAIFQCYYIAIYNIVIFQCYYIALKYNIFLIYHVLKWQCSFICHHLTCCIERTLQQLVSVVLCFPTVWKQSHHISFTAVLCCQMSR